MSARAIRRWGDNDRHFGPFTFAFRESWRPFAIILSSGGREDDEGGCCIRFQAFGATMICELPQIVRPWRRWVDTSRHGWSDNPRGGYWDQYPREYGFTLSDGHLSVNLGAQTHDSETTQRWGYSLPWTEWRQISHRLYHGDGAFHADVASMPWEKRHSVEDQVRKAHFQIEDYDGEIITASVHPEGREWRRGVRWFKWLGWVVPRRRGRSLDISFASEVGTSKGSWKGGLIGTGIAMEPGEDSETAFRRYCDQEHRSRDGKYRIRFVGNLADANSKKAPSP